MGEHTVFCALRRFEVILLVGSCLLAYTFLVVSRQSALNGGKPTTFDFSGLYNGEYDLSAPGAATAGRIGMNARCMGGGSGGGGGGVVYRSETQRKIPKAVLLPTAMDFIRRGFPVSEYYNYAPLNYTGREKCSCENPKAHSDCCKRSIRRTHKMGTIMTQHIFDRYGISHINRPHNYLYADLVPPNDFRDVLVFRDMYAALVSGYLFHQEGHECDSPTHQGEPYIRTWYHSLTYNAGDVHTRTLCEYLQQEPEEVGMRAYIEWAFRYQFVGILSHFALGKELSYIGERQMVVCFEDLASPLRDEETLHAMLDFWYNGTNHKPYTGKLTGHMNYTGPHATPHDPVLRSHLVDVIHKIDRQYYNSEIAWVSTLLPCYRGQ